MNINHIPCYGEETNPSKTQDDIWFYRLRILRWCMYSLRIDAYGAENFNSVVHALKWRYSPWMDVYNTEYPSFCGVCLCCIWSSLRVSCCKWRWYLLKFLVCYACMLLVFISRAFFSCKERMIGFVVYAFVFTCYELGFVLLFSRVNMWLSVKNEARVLWIYKENRVCFGEEKM